MTSRAGRAKAGEVAAERLGLDAGEPGAILRISA